MSDLKDIAGSGVLGALPAVLSKNPDAFRAFGVLGNLAANKIEDREEEKKRQTEDKLAQLKTQPMKKGGKVSSASKRADGCAQRGKTRGRIV